MPWLPHFFVRRLRLPTISTINGAEENWIHNIRRRSSSKQQVYIQDPFTFFLLNVTIFHLMSVFKCLPQIYLFYECDEKSTKLMIVSLKKRSKYKFHYLIQDYR